MSTKNEFDEFLKYSPEDMSENEYLWTVINNLIVNRNKEWFIFCNNEYSKQPLLPLYVIPIAKIKNEYIADISHVKGHFKWEMVDEKNLEDENNLIVVDSKAPLIKLSNVITDSTLKIVQPNPLLKILTGENSKFTIQYDTKSPVDELFKELNIKEKPIVRNNEISNIEKLKQLDKMILNDKFGSISNSNFM